MKTFILVFGIFLITASVQAQDIFERIKKNDLDKVSELIGKDASQISVRDDAGNTPLHIAVLYSSTPIVKLLLLNGADINSTNGRLNTPLHEAIIKGEKDIAVLLIGKGTDIKKQNIAMKTPLHLVALYTAKGKDLAELLISRGADMEIRDDYNRTPLLLAARQTGNTELGELLLQKGADINAADKYGDTPLSLAAWRGFKGFIDLLLDKGADFDTARGRTLQMLRFAADCGSERLFNFVSRKSNSLFNNEHVNKSTMRRAVTGGSIEIVKMLLEKNIPIPTDANIYGWTPVHYLALNGHAPMIEYLSKQNIDLNKRTMGGKSPYNLARENNQNEVLQMLIHLKADTSQEKFPVLSGNYLGQTLPVSSPLLFAPDIVSSPNGDDNHGGITFTPDGKQIFWNLRGKIWTTILQNSKWTIPEVAAFSKGNQNYLDDNPFILPDGKRMFFTSYRPGSVSEKKENIWYVERTGSGWSASKPVNSMVNSLQIHWGISVSSSGTLFFGGKGQDDFGGGDIYYSRLVNGEYTKPVNIGPSINSKALEHCPYIAPDESYLIFSRMDNAESGFYISFKSKEGQWLPAQNLKGEFYRGVCPSISPDGKYFFFSSEGIFWMSSKFIEELKPIE